MANKSVVIVFKDGVLIPKYWTNIKECSRELKLSYWTIARLKSPINYQEFKILRLPKNK